MIIASKNKFRLDFRLGNLGGPYCELKNIKGLGLLVNLENLTNTVLIKYVGPANIIIKHAWLKNRCLQNS